MSRQAAQPIFVRRSLLARLLELRGGGADPSNTIIAKVLGLPSGLLSVLTALVFRQLPSLEQLGRLAAGVLVPPETLFDRPTDPWLIRDRGVCWRLAGNTEDPAVQAARIAAAGGVLGWPLGTIRERIVRLRRVHHDASPAPDPDELRFLVRSGLNHGYVVAMESEAGDELLDAELSERLTIALRHIAPKGVEPSARVVVNRAHADFGRDPVAPYLIARVAQAWTAAVLAERPKAYRIGIAGGVHVEAFVYATGSGAPLFGALKRDVVVVPLTREPLYDHRYVLADALVAVLQSRLAVLLAPRRVEAPSFLAFGSIHDGAIKFEHDEIGGLRKHYAHLDVALFGCGDHDDDDGWIKLVMRILNLQLDEPPVTDVCLNLLSKDARPIPLRGPKGLFEYLGVRLRDVQGVAESKGKLALLLTSGAAKGLPLTIVVRAGCANGVICDQAAARAALEVLAS